MPPESPSDFDRGKRVPSDFRGILRPSRVAIATRIYSGSWTFARCYHEGFEDGAGRHPVRRLFRPEHGEDGERSRPILEAHEIVGVIDHTKTGRDAGEVLDGKPNGIPIVARLREATDRLAPQTLIVGVATFGV